MFDLFSDLGIMDLVSMHTSGRKCCLNGCDSDETRPMDPVFGLSLEECVTMCDENSACEYISHNIKLHACVFCADQPTTEWPGSIVYSMKGNTHFKI